MGFLSINYIFGTFTCGIFHYYLYFSYSEEEIHSTFEKRTRSHQYGQSCLDSPPPISLSSTEDFQSQHPVISQEWVAGVVHCTSSNAQPPVTEGDAEALTSPPHEQPAAAQNEAEAFGRTGCNDECNNGCRAISAMPCIGGRSLRISARVQNKQRREEERDLAASHPHKKIELTGKHVIKSITKILGISNFLCLALTLCLCSLPFVIH